MRRWSIVAFLGCLYVAVSAWIVGRAGQAYRDSLRESRLAAGNTEQPPQAAADLKRPPSTAAVPADRPVGPEPAVAATTVAGGPPPATRVPEPTPPAQAVADHDKAKPQAAPTENRAPARPVVTVPAPADPLAGDPFWSLPQSMRTWDLANLSAQDEHRLGAELHDVIVHFNPIAADGSWLKRVEDVANPLLENRLRKEITYKFTILDSDEVNAFSHPGGYVYLTRGLFGLIGEDEDYALQFAVGHEIAHVDLRHAIKCLQDPDVAKMNGGTLRKLYWLIIPFGYLVSEKVNQDYQADEWVFDRMRNLGRSKRETLAFLNKLDGYASKHGFKDGKAKVQLHSDSSLLDIHYRRQTAAWRRLEHLKERIK